MQIKVVTIFCAIAATHFDNMRKGEGTVNVGKRGTPEIGGGVPFPAFHRSGDQSLANNIYFPRQISSYHLVRDIYDYVI